MGDLAALDTYGADLPGYDPRQAPSADQPRDPIASAPSSAAVPDTYGAELPSYNPTPAWPEPDPAPQFPAPPQAEMRSRDPTFGENVANYTSDALRYLGADNYNAGRLGWKAGNVAGVGGEIASILTPIGMATAVGDMRRGIEEGSPFDVITGAAGAIPGVKVGGRIAKAALKEAEVAAPSIIRSAEPLQSVRYFGENAQRDFAPGIYKDPRVIASEANANVAPEHPALKELFGVTRGDLYDISQQGTREGNVAPNIFQPANPRGSYAAKAIMNDPNAQRMIDTLTEARKYPGLEQGMVPWYVMDPAFQRMVQLVGKEQAVKDYERFNSTMTPFSASSDVMKEINRGTAARMMAEQGRFADFVKYGGIAEADRTRRFPPEMQDVISHPYHKIHTDPVANYLKTGEHGYSEDTVKIPLYTQASGVPETGFQTAWAVPDAHFTRAVGMADVRKNQSPGEYMGGSEYRTLAPWFRQKVADPLGIQAVPAQALTWGTYAPQTGVRTAIGAGKLELLSQRIWERAQQLGIDPKVLRDQVLRGEQHASLGIGVGGAAAMGGLAAHDQYETT